MNYKKFGSPCKKKSPEQEVTDLFLKTYHSSGLFGVKQIGIFFDSCKYVLGVIKEGSEVYNGHDNRYISSGIIPLSQWTRDQEQNPKRHFIANTFHKRVSLENKEGRRVLRVSSCLEEAVFEEILEKFEQDNS